MKYRAVYLDGKGAIVCLGGVGKSKASAEKLMVHGLAAARAPHKEQLLLYSKEPPYGDISVKNTVKTAVVVPCQDDGAPLFNF